MMRGINQCWLGVLAVGAFLAWPFVAPESPILAGLGDQTPAGSLALAVEPWDCRGYFMRVILDHPDPLTHKMHKDVAICGVFNEPNFFNSFYQRDWGQLAPNPSIFKEGKKTIFNFGIRKKIWRIMQDEILYGEGAGSEVEQAIAQGYLEFFGFFAEGRERLAAVLDDQETRIVGIQVEHTESGQFITVPFIITTDITLPDENIVELADEYPIYSLPCPFEQWERVKGIFVCHPMMNGS